MKEVTLEMAQEALYAEFSTVPFHDHLGVALDREAPPGQPRVTLPARPEIVSEDGEHSPAAIYTLGEAASAIELCDAIAPRAVQLGMGAIFFTVAGAFELRAPARGTIGAITELAKGLEDGVGGDGGPRKARVEVASRVVGEAGELVAEQRFGFYVRFMERTHMREIVRPASAVGRLVDP